MKTRDELQAECSHWRETAERLSARRDELERRVAELKRRVEELEDRQRDMFTYSIVQALENRIDELETRVSSDSRA